MSHISFSLIREGLRKLMRDQKLTQGDLAELLDVSTFQISSTLSGKTNPNRENREKMEELLKNEGYFTRLGFPTEKMGEAVPDAVDQEQLSAMGIRKSEPSRDEIQTVLTSLQRAIAIGGIMSMHDVPLEERYRILQTLNLL